MMRSAKYWLQWTVLIVAITAATAGAAEPVASRPAKVSEQLIQQSAGRVRSDWVGQLFSFGMVPLWICSVVLVALIFERAKALRAGKIIDEAMIDRVADHVGSGDLAAARSAAESSDTVLGRAWAHALGQFSPGGAPLGDVLTHATLLAFKPLKRNLRAMSTIGVISPSFGLLGTVVGMIIVFSQIELTGGADKGELAGGIGLALFTTAGGLVVAIPAILTSRFFTSKLTGLAESAEEAISRVNFRYIQAKAKGESTEGK